MKLLVVLCIIGAVAAAPPLLASVKYPSASPYILVYKNDNVGVGNYKYAFEQSDGIKQEQQGELRNEGTKEETLVVRGSYSWTGPDGVTYVVTYVADENGFQPQIEQGPGGGVPPGVVASLLG